MKEPAKKPCAECPFRRDSHRSWLGAYTLEEFLSRWERDTQMECHMTVDYDDPDWREHLDCGAYNYCAGSIIMFANECKTSRDPDRPKLLVDREVVLNNRLEFRAHHTLDDPPEEV